MAAKTRNTEANKPSGLTDDERDIEAAIQDLEAAIRLRAYEISQSPDAGTPEENWVRAELEIRPARTDR